MAKKILICCDGTGNEFGDRNSNVVRIFQSVTRVEGQVVTYYHPGVGTMGATNALTQTGKVWTKLKGLGFGYGMSENMADAYRFLMRNYESGDEIYIFGFSRGAYTARALCGMLQMFGLLYTGNEGLIPYAVRLFKKSPSRRFASLREPFNKYRLAASFKNTFSRECAPHFLGLWDTVSSIGWFFDPFGAKLATLPYTFALPEVAIIRHAVSIDERRAFFRTNLVSQTHPNLKQVWFAGVHSDVGGGYPEAESGLAKISLRWMAAEAASAGLPLNQSALDRMLGTDPRHLRHAPPIVTAQAHNSLRGLWRLAELWPKVVKTRAVTSADDSPKYTNRIRVNLFRRRLVPNGARIHESVWQRIQHVSAYRPANLPKQYEVERDDIPLAAYPVRLERGQSKEVAIFSRPKWTDTGIEMRAAESYNLVATGRWYDASISTSAAGFTRLSAGFRLVERFRRKPDSNWFALIGDLQNGQGAFQIGSETELKVTATGVLRCFANDLPLFYRNNSGHLRLKVTRSS